MDRIFTRYQNVRAERRSRVPIYYSASILFLAAVGLVVWSWSAIQGYLRGDEFRAFLAERTGQAFGVRGEYAPLRWNGDSVYTDAFDARADGGGALRTMKAERVRADLDLSRAGRGAWGIRDLTIGRLSLDFEPPASRDAEAAPPPPAPQAASQELPKWLSSRLPSKIEVDRVLVESGKMRWTGETASVVGDKLHGTLQPEGADWVAHVDGGQLQAPLAGQWDIRKARVRLRRGGVHLLESELKLAEGGQARADGEWQYGGGGELRVSFDSVPVGGHLSPEWRGKLEGQLSGSQVLEFVGGSGRGFKAKGTMNLVDGRLSGVPVLDKIAEHTRNEQFRMMPIQLARANYIWDGSVLQVADLLAESEGLLRVAGNCRIQNGMIEGEFEVGVTPSSLRWLPGAERRVFTVERGPYLCTNVKISGPLDNPQEDLSGRLVAAAGGELFDAVGGGVRDVEGAVKKGVGGVLDLLMPR